MSTITISLPAEMKAFIDAQIVKIGYARERLDERSSELRARR